VPYQIQTVHLSCSTMAVDARLVQLRWRWLASVDAPEGPSLGYGRTALAALWMALQPFDGVIGELLASLPDGAVAG
jgi:hypothetical protein